MGLESECRACMLHLAWDGSWTTHFWHKLCCKALILMGAVIVVEAEPGTITKT